MHGISDGPREQWEAEQDRRVRHEALALRDQIIDGVPHRCDEPGCWVSESNEVVSGL